VAIEKEVATASSRDKVQAIEKQKTQILKLEQCVAAQAAVVLVTRVKEEVYAHAHTHTHTHINTHTHTHINTHTYSSAR
jgi:glutamyl-tRNA reductase